MHSMYTPSSTKKPSRGLRKPKPTHMTAFGLGLMMSDLSHEYAKEQYSARPDEQKLTDIAFVWAAYRDELKSRD